MNKLQTINNSLTKEYKDKLSEAGFNDLQVGDFVYHKNYDACEIYKIDDKGLHMYDSEKNEHHLEYHYIKEYIVKMTMTMEEYEKEATEFFLNPKEYELKQKLLTANSKESDTSALMVKGSDTDLLNAQALMQKLTDKLKILNHILADKKRQLENIREEFMTKLKQINRVITILEIYMGIDEEIVQFKEGVNASFDETLHFRQKLLYMDEELADYMINGGADINNIEDFQEWLITNDNYKILVPEEKCVVAMRPRRKDKEYGDKWMNAGMNSEEVNFATFVLIRNGENLYRIWTNKFNIKKRLFPKTDQFEKIQVEKERFGEKYTEEEYKEGYWNDESMHKAQEHFKFNVLMMQGLIDRTEIFKPMKDKVNLFDPRTYGDSVRLVCDDEMVVHTGRPSFREYMKELNKGLKRGSRVYVDRFKEKKTDGRFRHYYSNEYSIPNYPNAGVYTIDTMKRWQWDNVEEKNIISHYDRYVKRTKEQVLELANEEVMFITYNPGGTIINYWDRYDDGHERKNKIKFLIDLDDKIFNYDVLDLSDIEYYLSDRIERHDYLYMFDIAKDLKKLRQEEIEWEKSFVRLVKDRNQCSEELVWECVEWWKLKNIWKRPITNDDAKALRMIEKRIKKLIKK